MFRPTAGRKVTPRRILGTYVTLTLLSTFASSFIWGINTLFLLDAGLSIGRAFAANAFFTAGEVLFEVPTGIVADTLGRRASYLMGAATLLASTILYWWLWHVHGPFWGWAATSMLLGLGFTFFSGATDAWLVDGLTAAGHHGRLESAFAKGQIASGAAMLTGTLAGGAIAQATNLGVPYLLRAGMLALTFAVAFALMHDDGFTPKRGASLLDETRGIFRASLDYGLRNPPARWLMLAAPFAGGVSIYAFYAMQPYLLELHGGKRSYAIAGLAASIVAGAQIVGGLIVPWVSRHLRRRTTLLLVTTVAGAASLALLATAPAFWVALALLAVWALVFSAAMPVRQALLNDLIPSAQRATVLSSDNLLASSGGVVLQPLLGRTAEVWGYPASYLVAAGLQLLGAPFVVLARRLCFDADSAGEAHAPPPRGGRR
jgi:MFS family permease